MGNYLGAEGYNIGLYKYFYSFLQFKGLFIYFKFTIHSFLSYQHLFIFVAVGPIIIKYN